MPPAAGAAAWTHGGGLEPGARVWVPALPANGSTAQQQQVTGWVRAKVVKKEEAADGSVEFVVQEEDPSRVSALGPWHITSSKSSVMDTFPPHASAISA